MGQQGSASAAGLTHDTLAAGGRGSGLPPTHPMSSAEQQRTAQGARARQEDEERKAKARAEIARLTILRDKLTAARLRVRDYHRSIAGLNAMTSSTPYLTLMLLSAAVLLVSPMVHLALLVWWTELWVLCVGAVIYFIAMPERAKEFVRETAIGVWVIVHGLCMLWMHPAEVACGCVLIWLLSVCEQLSKAPVSSYGGSGLGPAANTVGGEALATAVANVTVSPFGGSPTRSRASSQMNSPAKTGAISEDYSDILGVLGNNKGQPQTVDGGPTCSVCLDNIPDVAFIPCGHVRCCVECCRRLCTEPANRGTASSAAVTHRCPDCRARIEQVFYPARCN